jgi:hypothetical protein
VTNNPGQFINSTYIGLKIIMPTLIQNQANASNPAQYPGYALNYLYSNESRGVVQVPPDVLPEIPVQGTSGLMPGNAQTAYPGTGPNDQTAQSLGNTLSGMSMQSGTTGVPGVTTSIYNPGPGTSVVGNIPIVDSNTPASSTGINPTYLYIGGAILLFIILMK